MTPQAREELERQVRLLCEQGEHARAAATATHRDEREGLFPQE